MAEPGEPKKIEVREKVPEKRIEPKVTEEEKVREELRKFRAIEEEKKRLQELEREESIERFKAIEEEERKKIQEELKRKQEKGLEEKKKKEEKKRREVIKEIVIGELPERYGEKYKEFIGDLIGRDDNDSWKKREKIVNPRLYAMSLAGVASPLSRQEVDLNLENREMWPWLKYPLMSDNTPEAWRLRKKIEWDEEANRLRAGRWARFLQISGFNKSELLSRGRENIVNWLPYPGWYWVDDIFKSTVGIKLDESPEKLELFEKEYKGKKYTELAPRGALECLAGDNSSRARDIAKKIYGGDPRLKDLYDAYQKSIEGLSSEE